MLINFVDANNDVTNWAKPPPLKNSEHETRTLNIGLTGAVSATASRPRHSSSTYSAARPLQCCESCRGSAPSVSARGRWRRRPFGSSRRRHWPKCMTLAGLAAVAGNPTDRGDGSPPRSSRWNVSSQQDTGSTRVTQDNTCDTIRYDMTDDLHRQAASLI